MYSLQPDLGWEEGMSSHQLETDSLSVDIHMYVLVMVSIAGRSGVCW